MGCVFICCVVMFVKVCYQIPQFQEFLGTEVGTRGAIRILNVIHMHVNCVVVSKKKRVFLGKNYVLY